MTHPLQPIALDALNRFDTVHVAIDSTDVRCALPARFVDTGNVVLRFEPRNPHNVQNLAIEDYGITALMSFDGAPFTVRVPWGAIAAIHTPAYLVQVNPDHAPKRALRVVR